MNIPATVWDAKIRANAKLCYGHVTVLANKKGYSWASNQYYATALGVSKTTASQYISELVNLGVITVKIILKPNSKEVLERRIYITSALMGTKEINGQPNEETSGQPIEDNFKGNTTRINTTRINTNKVSDVSSVDDIKTKIFNKIVELYPKNRIGNKKEVLNKFKKLDIKEAKLAATNLKRYLKCAGQYIKSLKKYIAEECYSEEWLEPAETKTNKSDITNTKTFKGDYDEIN
jgi:hypothetical protein